MKNFFPLPERQQCEWCENLANIAVLSTEGIKTPICVPHYQFFTEPLAYWAWKNRKDGTGLRRMNYTK